MTQTLPTAFAAAVTAFGPRPALISETGDVTSYAELDALRLQAAQALMAAGIGCGDRVALWAPNTPEWVIAALGVQTLGAVLVPINTRMRGQEVSFILQRSRARLLFCAGRFLNQYLPQQIKAHRPDTLERLVVLGDAEGEDQDWSSFLTQAAAVDAAAVDASAAEVAPDHLMDIMFTSGTTGQPKGVMSAHGQNLRVAREWGTRMQLVPEDRYLVINPFFHAFGYKAGWLTALLHGSAILPQAVFDAATVIRRIEEERVSVLPGPPTLFVSLLDAPERAKVDLSSLRATMTGAASVPPVLVERMRAELGFKVLLTGYGLTECSGMVSFCYPEDEAVTVATTCGKALPGTEVRIVNEAGESQPPGVEGEVVVRGYNLMQGYLDDPKATAETIDQEGWLHTGDIGVLDERGYLRITDRLKDLYISGGFNCYPAEIERMMAAHPDIAQVAIIGVPDERLGEVGKAFVIPRPGHVIDPPAVIAWCREQMANYKVPRSIEIVESLPTNAAGKIMKFELRSR